MKTFISFYETPLKLPIHIMQFSYLIIIFATVESLKLSSFEILDELMCREGMSELLFDT